MTAETSCVWHSGCPALIQCATAGRCLSIPKDIADTQTEVSPSNRPLMRYGIKWNGPREPIGTPMEDGYWTPWHIAQGEIERLRDELQRARIELAQTASEALRTIGKVAMQPETSAPVWKRMRDEVPANGTWIWWDYGKGPMLQRAQDFASEDDGYWIEATPPLLSPGEPK